MRLYIGRNYVPKFRGKLFEDKDLKMTNQRNWARKLMPCAQGMTKQQYAPRAWLMCPKHLKCEGRMRNFIRFCGFSPNPVRNLHYKYQYSSFKIARSELWQFKRKETLELRESFYLLLDFLGYVFICSNLFLVTMCN